MTSNKYVAICNIPGLLQGNIISIVTDTNGLATEKVYRDCIRDKLLVLVPTNIPEEVQEEVVVVEVQEVLPEVQEVATEVAPEVLEDVLPKVLPEALPRSNKPRVRSNSK
jgi:hypothetical protein